MARKRNWWELDPSIVGESVTGTETTNDDITTKGKGTGQNIAKPYQEQNYSKRNDYSRTSRYGGIGPDLVGEYVPNMENTTVFNNEPLETEVLNGNSKRHFNDSPDRRVRFTIQNKRNEYQDKDHTVSIWSGRKSGNSKTLEEWMRLNQEQKKNNSGSNGQSGSSSSGSGCDCDKKKEEEKKTGEQIGEQAAQAGNTASPAGTSTTGGSSTGSGSTGSSTSGANSQGNDGCDCSGGGSGSGSSGSVKTSEAIENPFGVFFSRLESVLDSRRNRGSGLIASTGKFDGLDALTEEIFYSDGSGGEGDDYGKKMKVKAYTHPDIKSFENSLASSRKKFDETKKKYINYYINIGKLKSDSSQKDVENVLSQSNKSELNRISKSILEYKSLLKQAKYRTPME